MATTTSSAPASSPVATPPIPSPLTECSCGLITLNGKRYEVVAMFRGNSSIVLPDSHQAAIRSVVQNSLGCYLRQRLNASSLTLSPARIQFKRNWDLNLFWIHEQAGPPSEAKALDQPVPAGGIKMIELDESDGELVRRVEAFVRTKSPAVVASVSLENSLQYVADLVTHPVVSIGVTSSSVVDHYTETH